MSDVLTERVSEQFLWPLPLVDFVPLGHALLFRAWDGLHGWELWRTDGTRDGTRLLADICPGDCTSYPWELRALLGKVYFLARDGDHGQAIWRTDGTPSGTELVVDVQAGQASDSLSAYFTEFQDALYFVVDDGVHGRELWRSDGESGGISEMVADIRPGPEGSSPASLYVVGDSLYFVANDGVVGLELWRTDGTAAGTSLVADLCPGPEGCFLVEDVSIPSGPWSFASVEDRLILTTYRSAFPERGLWVTDGTAAGTELLGEFESGTQLYPFRGADGAVLFSAQIACCEPKLWRTDGTPEGTHAVGDVEAYDALAASGGAIFFAGAPPDGVGGWALWRTDGSEAGTSLVTDPGPGTALGAISVLVPLVPWPAEGPIVYLQADDGQNGIELWRSDGTAEGTFLLADINPGLGNGFEPWSLPNFAAELDGRLLFYAFTPEYRFRLWSTDGSGEGTALLHEIDLQASAMERVPPFFEPDMAAAGEVLLFLAEDGEHGRELWGTDGTAEGTVLVKDVCGPTCPTEYPEPSRSLTSVGNRVYFAGDDGVQGPALWVSDGTSAGTHPVDPAAPEGYPYWLTPWTPPGGPPRLLFMDGSSPALLSTDGTAAGTYALTPGGPDPGFPYFPKPAGSNIFFAWTSDYPDSELWLSRGAPADARRVLDIRPGGEGSEPQPLAALGDRVVLSADDGIVGREPWVSDGSAAGTYLLADINPGPESSMRYDYFGTGIAAAGGAYFPADDGSSGEELWRSDGTPEGTLRVADLNPGPAPSNPRPWVEFAGKLYLTAWDEVHGRELWAADGTSARLVIDLDPGPGSGLTDWQDPVFESIPRLRQPLVVWRGRLYFAGTDGEKGIELWATDGTAAGTIRAGDLNPGRDSSNPAGFTPLGAQLFFGATDGMTGFELWALGEPTP